MHSAFNGDEAYKDTVEQEVIQLWDHVYNTWFAKVCWKLMCYLMLVFHDCLRSFYFMYVAVYTAITCLIIY